MRCLYLETSVVVDLLLEEGAFQKVLGLLEKQDQVLTSILTLWETRRVLSRLSSLGELNAARKNKLWGDIERIAKKWEVMEITPEIQTRVGENFPCEPVRTLDAIHLATALEFSKSFSSLEVLSFDERIISNLTPLGLTLAH